MPHAVVGALCVGCALANAARIPPLPAVIVATLAAVIAFLVSGRRRVLVVVAAVALAGWAWGSVRLVQLDRSVLVSRIGTVERAVVEVDEEPKAGSFDERARAVLLRWGSLKPAEPVYLELPLGRAPPQGADIALLAQLRAPSPPANGFDQATWLRRQGIH